MALEVRPLNNLEELLSWSLPEDLKIPLELLTDLQPNSKSVSLDTGTIPEKPFKTLVCHDHHNGYHDDRFVFGSTDDTSYRFYHWSGVDSFVYFSHHFVTIPPCGWVNAAHTNGVKMLGTFITEWDEGSKVWQQILQSKMEVDQVTTLLVDIAIAYRFDGWLLNVENEIAKEKIDLLLLFVGELRRKMHEASDVSEIIWYDGVTVEGKLEWQNELNHLNKPFFDLCDGIFINYTWTEDNLEKSLNLAGDRYIDVYVGLDVFGRNFYKGGGFNTDQALNVVRKYNLSAAIFAQAWTYETLGKSCNFFSNENSLWSSLSPYLLYHGPIKLPLRTSFCSGFGQKMYSNGLVAKDETWFNLLRQDVQPIWEEFSREGFQFSISADNVYNGGSSLSIWYDNFESVRLMLMAIPVENPLKLTFVYQTTLNIRFVSICLILEVHDTSDDSFRDEKLYFICEISSKCHERPTKHCIIETHEESEENSWKKRSFYWRNDSLVNKSVIKDYQLCCQGPGLVTIGELSIDAGDPQMTN